MLLLADPSDTVLLCNVKSSELASVRTRDCSIMTSATLLYNVIWKINKRLSAIASGVGHYRRLPGSPIVLRKANELQVAGVSWHNAAGLELVRIS